MKFPDGTHPGTQLSSFGAKLFVEVPREALCTAQAWCIREHGHGGPCAAIPRGTSPKRAPWEDRLGLRDPKGWRENGAKR